jgi:small subunit ribosomal protein S6
MRRYETIVIADPDIPEDQRTPLFERMKEIIDQQGGFLIDMDEWGRRKLAYEIKKKPRGYYVRLEYCGMGPAVDELERFFRIDDRVLKFMTILLEEAADVEAIRTRMAEAEAAEATAAEAADAAPAGESGKNEISPEAGDGRESAPETAENETAPSTRTKEEA